MAIKAKNMKVGGVEPPTKTKSESPPSAKKVNSFSELISNNRVQAPVKTIEKVEPIVEAESKYIHKTDGELIRHINKKSAYLRDMLEVSN